MKFALAAYLVFAFVAFCVFVMLGLAWVYVGTGLHPALAGAGCLYFAVSASWVAGWLQALADAEIAAAENLSLR